MKFYGVTLEDLNTALDAVNESYDGNIAWNAPPQPAGYRKPYVTATIRVNDCGGPGAGRGSSPPGSSRRRRLVSACWHAHRDFFRELYKIAPDTEIRTAYTTYHDSADFEDRHRSSGDPLRGGYQGGYASDYCECRGEGT